MRRRKKLCLKREHLRHTIQPAISSHFPPLFYFGCDSCNAMVSSRLACMSQPFLHTKIIIPVLVQSGMFYSLTFFGNKGLIDFFSNRHPVRKFSLPSHHYYYHPHHLRRRPKSSPIPISTPPPPPPNAFFSLAAIVSCADERSEADLGNAERGRKRGEVINPSSQGCGGERTERRAAYQAARAKRHRPDYGLLAQQQQRSQRICQFLN